jgi:adenylate cyclase
MTQQESEEYYKTLWAHPFPWMQIVESGKKFDPSQAWIGHNGIVATGVYANIAILADAAKSSGFFDFVPDIDGTYRHAPLLIRYRDRDWQPSLAVQTVREFENIKDQSIAGYLAEDGMERMEIGEHRITPGADGTVLINYTGPYNTYAHYSMADVIDGTVPADIFKGKIVLFGATAVAIGDIRNTPFRNDKQEYMGVEMHANVIDNILHSGERGRGFLSRGHREEVIDIFFILLFGLAMGRVFGRAKPLKSTLSLLVVLALFLCIVQSAFSYFGMWLSFMLPAETLVANYAAITSFRMIFEEREKRKVRKTFERYVSPGVIALIEKDPQKYFKAGGESKDLTVMFSDIRSFTTISEGLTPDQLVALLNEYLGDMTDILFRRWGTLDKYIGDAIMAFWGSPFPQDDHHVRACACALDMRARLEELNMKWESQGKNPLAIGIGINSGEVNVGNMGSSKRFAWTVMGDNVNLASRLEGITKEYHVQCVVSESTYAAAKDQYVFRELDKIRVKGKLLPVTIYELLDWGPNAAKHTERLAAFSEALTAYRRQQFQEAAALFERLLQRFPDDGPSEVFLKRSLEFADDMPEPSWDGVYVMKTK